LRINRGQTTVLDMLPTALIHRPEQYAYKILLNRGLSSIKLNLFVFLLTFLVLTGEIFALEETVQTEEAIESSSYHRKLQENQKAITRLESEQGAYSPALREALLELAYLYRNQGDYLNAGLIFERALHVSKANEGLHELSQVEIVELLIETYSELQNWVELDRNLHYLLWLYRRNYSHEDDRLLPVIERVGRWYMQAYQLHNGGDALSYMVKADDLYDKAMNIIISQHGDEAKQISSVLNAAAMVNYQIAYDVNDVFRMSHRDIRQAMIPNKRPSPYLNEIAVRDFYFDQSFHKGKRHLARIVSIYEAGLPDTVQEYAQALVYMGDYYLSLKRKWNAMKNYEKAYTTLAEHNADTEVINTIFGQPRKIKPFSIPGNEVSVNADSSYADVVFNVPSNGWPRDIVITAIQPQSDTNLSVRARHAVAATRYRPRFENGKPVGSTGVTLRYIFAR
jgi:tetratricopeptide (TPR) repeat protein